ncbi:uncharacterized protein LOC143031406 [Oratosquilla oratoria]|uniref:uncharacterized protein LOC143031406 n=1 Tax=Oratosquilla oratoria TaxID=337810 RepID=UPI003F768858
MHPPPPRQELEMKDENNYQHFFRRAVPRFHLSIIQQRESGVTSAAQLSYMMTHTEEKPFQCNLCNAAFSKKSHLKCHELTHTGEKPFQCNLCSAAFSAKSSVKPHMTTHTGEKPF